MVKERLVLALLAASSVGVFLADVVLTPEILLPAAAYAAPVVLAAWFFAPRQVAALAIWTCLLEIVAAFFHQAPAWLFAIYMMGIAFFGTLSTALSARLRREAANAAEARLRAEERERLVRTLEEQAERLALQNEELQSQAEELQLQAEELTSQNEELLAQRAEMRKLVQERTTMVESIADAVFVCDDRGVLTLSNRAGMKLIGASGLENRHTLATYLRGLELKYSDGRPVQVDDFAISCALRGETVVGRETVGVHPVSGHRVDMLVSAAPLRDQAGQVTGAVEVAADLSRFKEVEAEREKLLATLGESNRRLTEANRHCEEMAETAERRAAELTNVLNNMVDAVLVCDSTGRITLTNQSADDLLGRPVRVGTDVVVEDVRSILNTRYPDGRFVPRRAQPLVRALDGETLQHEDLVVRSAATGRDLHLRVSAAPIRDARGYIIGAVSLSRDVTELIELEHMKDQLIAVSAHELKTPVTIMKGFSQLLLRKDPDLSPERRKILNSIDRGADRINTIVQEMLDISLLTTGRLTLTLQSTNLGEFVQQVLKRWDPASPNHEIKLVRADQAVVQADRNRLEQVLVNLLDNAVLYSPSGGPVEVEVRLEEGRVVVAVSDHGIGIPALKHARIFERLYRAHSSTPYDRGGMGVGLYLSRQIIMRHGGEMDFESVEGVGSTFFFSLPLEESDGN